MTRIVTLEEFTPGERVDGLPWTLARIEEAATAGGARTSLATINLATGPGVSPTGLDTDPSEPQPRTLTTSLAQLNAGYYWVVFIDAAAHEQEVGPVFAPAQAETYTSPVAVRRVLSPDGDRTDTGSAASLSDDDLEQAIAEAQAEIDARLASRYTVPFSFPVPVVIEQATRDIAAYLGTLTFRRGDPIDANDPVQLRYNRAQALLASIQAGKTELPVGSDGPLSEATADAEVINPYDGDLFQLSDFALGAGSFRYPGMMPGADEGLL